MTNRTSGIECSTRRAPTPFGSSPIATVFAILVLPFLAPDAHCDTPATHLYINPQRVSILGYNGDAMEPFITRDGRYLLFNNRNDTAVNTNLHFAERIDDLTFRYRGEVQGVNTAALEGVPSVDRQGTIYFVSTRSYEKTLSTIYRGTFVDGKVSSIEVVPGVSRGERGIVNFDVDVSPDGATLYFVDGRFGRGGPPKSADIVIAQRSGTGFVRRPESAQILTNVNTKDLEYAPCISADGLTLLFTRLHLRLIPRIGIFVTQRKQTTQPFGPAIQLAALEGFVEAPTFAPDERAIYYHKREGTRFVIQRAAAASP